MTKSGKGSILFASSRLVRVVLLLGFAGSLLLSGCSPDSQSVSERSELESSSQSPNSVEDSTEADSFEVGDDIVNSLKVEDDDAPVRIERFGTTVRATIATSATEPGEILFTVPAGLRPGIPVVGHVQGFPLHEDSSIQHIGPIAATVQVDIDGKATRIEGEQRSPIQLRRLEGVMVWNLAESEPHVCQRSEGVRRAIVEQLVGVGEVQLTCDDVTWEDLATIHTLKRPGPSSLDRPTNVVGISNTFDLAGLVNLQEATFSVYTDRIPSTFLVHTPLLMALDVRLYTEDRKTVSGDAEYYSYVPNLKSLSLHVHRIHPDILASLPDLESLVVYPRGTWGLRDFLVPEGLLAHTPKLQQLSLSGMMSLPAGLLVHVPDLRRLTIELTGWHGDKNERTTVSPRILQNTAHLSDLTLKMGVVPENLLSNSPEIRRLGLSAGSIPDSLLENVSLLSELSIATDEVAGELLAHAPLLETLTLSSPYYGRPMKVPTDLFRFSKSLSELNILAGYGLVFTDGLRSEEEAEDPYEDNVTVEMPEGFLSHLPDLTRIRMDFGINDLALPEGFLNSSSDLEMLEVKAGDLMVPGDIFDGLDHLQTLVLDARLVNLAEDFHIQSPKLSQLQMKIAGPLPPDFLSTVPSLKYLDLWMLAPVDPGFLSYVPSLEHLNLFVRGPLPREFHLPLPFLSRLELDVGGSVPADLLSGVPALTHLRLAIGASFPLDLLLPVSALTNLHLTLAHPLPDDFFSYVPSLKRLVIFAVNDIFSFTLNSPNLTYLTLVTANFDVEFPSDLLAGTPALTELDILRVSRWAYRFSPVQDIDFSYVPELTKLVLGYPTVGLGSQSCEKLPADLQAFATRRSLYHLESVLSGLSDDWWLEQDLKDISCSFLASST